MVNPVKEFGLDKVGNRMHTAIKYVETWCHEQRLEINSTKIDQVIHTS